MHPSSPPTGIETAPTHILPPNPTPTNREHPMTNHTAKSLGIRPDIFAIMTSVEIARYALLHARWKEAVAIRQPLIINHLLCRGDAEEEAALKAAEGEIDATEEEMWGIRADAFRRTWSARHPHDRLHPTPPLQCTHLIKPQHLPITDTSHPQSETQTQGE